MEVPVPYQLVSITFQVSQERGRRITLWIIQSLCVASKQVSLICSVSKNTPYISSFLHQNCLRLMLLIFFLVFVLLARLSPALCLLLISKTGVWVHLESNTSSQPKSSLTFRKSKLTRKKFFSGANQFKYILKWLLYIL